MPSGSAAGHRHMRQRQLPAGPGGVGKPKPMMLKMPPGQSAAAAGWPLLPAIAMGNAPHQPRSALGSVLGRTRRVEENKPQSSREKDETRGITCVPKPLLLFLCKAAKRKSKPTT